MPCAFGSCNYNVQTKRAIILHLDWLVAPGACFFSGVYILRKGVQVNQKGCRVQNQSDEIQQLFHGKQS